MTSEVEKTSVCAGDSCGFPDDLSRNSNQTKVGGSVTLFKIRGMDCADEVAALRDVFKEIMDVEALRFDLLDGVMEVPNTISSDVVIERVAAAGLAAKVVGEESSEKGSWMEMYGMTALTVLSGLFVVFAFVLHGVMKGFSAAVGSEGMATTEAAVPSYIIGMYLISVASGITRIVPKALRAAIRLRPDMNLLMTIAVCGAMALGEWFEAATVSFLFAFSLSLESWSVGKARRAIEKLLSLAPPLVRIQVGNEIEEVSPDTVRIGQMSIVQPGERFALDGIIVDGVSDVDQAPITGESELVAKEEGDEVFAGTINGNGALEVRSTTLASDTTLAQVIEMVGNARKCRSDSERWVERFARIYTPLVLGVAALVAVVPPLIFGEAFSEWLYRALVLLVIGCPCALVIATPVAIVAGLAASARNGVLVKGGQFLEIPSRVSVVALDKTGTLTEGRPKVVSVESLDEHSSEELLKIAAAVETKSEHPIARAIVLYAQKQGVEIPDCIDVNIVPGKGTTGRVGDTSYWLGSHRWLEERKQESEDVHRRLEEVSHAGRSVVVVGTEDHVCGIITLADSVRESSKSAVRALYRAGVKKVVMLTGDNRGTAETIAKEVGIEDVRSELLPADKVVAVEDLESTVGPVAMIGDGVNDAPALARASLGVAMGVMGADVAVETADIALMTDDMGKLAWLIGHSKRTLGIIWQNTVFALAVKAIFVVLTFTGVASLWGAIAADMGASLLVVGNALRLLGAQSED